MEKDNLIRFTLEDNSYKGAVVSCKELLKLLQEKHTLGFLETFILGEAFVATALLSTTLKGNDRLNFSINCSGPIGGFSVDTNAKGEIRGYLNNNPIRYDYEKEDNINLLYGPGVLSVTKYLENSKAPYTSKIDLQLGSVAGDLTNFYFHSEQIPTIFILDIKINDDQTVNSAFGLFLQILPKTDIKDFEKIQEIFKGKEIFLPFHDEKLNLKKMVNSIFKNHNIKILETSSINFFCPCSRNYFLEHIRSLKKSGVDFINSKDDYPLHIKCHNCSEVYSIEEDEI